MTVTNSQGKIWYGLHMYPGVAEYREQDADPFRIFINDTTIREMGPSFKGRPVFVMHVSEVPKDLKTLRAEGDGWVIRSFFNEADGKHWAEFITTSEEAEAAIQKGYKLSNCYIPNSYSSGGTWNGLDYDKEVMNGEYEHLAIVPNPRYEESIILTPEQFKEYNEQKKQELAKLANAKQSIGANMMKFFRRAKVDNSADLETLSVTLKSGRDVTIVQLVNEADEADEARKGGQLANVEHLVDLEDGKRLSVGDLVAAYNAMCAAKNAESESDPLVEDETIELENEKAESAKEDKDRADRADSGAKAEDDERKENEEDEESEEEKEEKRKAEEKKSNARKASNALRNAGPSKEKPLEEKTYTYGSSVARGIARYGKD